MVKMDKEALFADSSVKTWNRIFVALYVLKILENAPSYGNHIRDEMWSMTKKLYKPNPNALYPVLRMLEDEGYISGEWDNPDTRGKRFYSITDKGTSLQPVLKERIKDHLQYMQDLVSAVKQNFDLP